MAIMWNIRCIIKRIYFLFECAQKGIDVWIIIYVRNFGLSINRIAVYELRSCVYVLLLRALYLGAFSDNYYHCPRNENLIISLNFRINTMGYDSSKNIFSVTLTWFLLFWNIVSKKTFSTTVDYTRMVNWTPRTASHCRSYSEYCEIYSRKKNLVKNANERLNLTLQRRSTI